MMAAMIPSVDGVTFEIRELVASQRAAAREEERERIVVWLRERARIVEASRLLGAPHPGLRANELYIAANIIERGES